MKKFRFLFAVLAGTVLYSVVSLLGGQDGLWAAKQMQEQKRILSTHTAEIQKLNDRLGLEYSALEHDPDVISAYARKLGYVSDGEKLVKINGLASSVTKIYDTGTIMKTVEPVYIPESFCKMFAFITGLLVFMFLMLNDHKYGLIEKKKHSFVKGIPVYDLPQM